MCIQSYTLYCDVLCYNVKGNTETLVFNSCVQKIINAILMIKKNIDYPKISEVLQGVSKD